MSDGVHSLLHFSVDLMCGLGSLGLRRKEAPSSRSPSRWWLRKALRPMSCLTEGCGMQSTCHLCPPQQLVHMRIPLSNQRTFTWPLLHPRLHKHPPFPSGVADRPILLLGWRIMSPEYHFRGAGGVSSGLLHIFFRFRKFDWTPILYNL